ncbi:MAG: hypothetical protein JNJ93_05495 [Acinetobacter sp.]|nr:hypothetical protein [Acinetobacter sp.]
MFNQWPIGAGFRQLRRKRKRCSQLGQLFRKFNCIVRSWRNWFGLCKICRNGSD